MLTYKMEECRKDPESKAFCSKPLSLFYTFVDSEHTRLPTRNFESFFTKSLKDFSYKNVDDDHTYAVNVTGKKGLYFAFRDEGSCSTVDYFSVIESYCEDTTMYLARFPKTIYKHDGKQMVNARECVDNASPNEGESYPAAYCTAADWLGHKARSRPCLCNPGYRNQSSTKCEACPLNSYKSVYGNEECKKCPDASYTPGTGHSSCQCLKNRYRAINESIDAVCRSPPNPPKWEKAPKVDHTDVTLSWKQDEYNTYGYAQWYTIYLEGFDEKVYSTTKLSYELKGLLPKTMYRAFVYSENDLTKGQVREISTPFVLEFTTKELPQITNLSVDEGTSDHNLLLTWTAEPATAQKFKIHVYLNENLQVMYETQGVTSYEVSTIQGGRYKFRVCFNEKGKEHICSKDYNVDVVGSDMLSVNPRNLVLGAAMVMAIVLSMLVLLLGAIWCYKRGNNNWSQMPYNAATLAHVATMPSIYSEMSRMPYNQAFVDPSLYDEPEKILFEFSREIFPDQIQFYKESDTDEDLDKPDLSPKKATLFTPDNQSCAIVVKSCLEADPVSMKAFCIEAGVMGQFYHPNVLMLHGVAVQNAHLLMCLEYACQGPLAYLLRQNPKPYTLMQLVHLLRGISCGMQYLSELGYVHKVLCSENVLLTASNVCKISGFGTRTMLDAEEAQGGKSSILLSLLPWLAPEVITHRRFTSQSDVYSFGVLMWEMLSQGEEPYHATSPSEAIKMIESGQCLPLPHECPAYLYDVMRHCWATDASERPTFAQIRETLENIVRNSAIMNEPYRFEVHSPKPMSHRGAYVPASTLCKPYLTHTAINPTSTVEDWLLSLKLQQYTNNFYSRNLIILKDILGLNAEALEAIGISSSKHRKKMATSLLDLANKNSVNLKKDTAVHIII